MSILSKHFALVNEHIAVQEKLAKKFAPETRLFNEYRHSLHLSNVERFKILFSDLEAADKLLDSAASQPSVQTPVLTLSSDELEGLPPELLAELSDGAIPDKSESALLQALAARGGIASLDQILIDLFKKTGEVLKRTTLTSKLYRLTQKGILHPVPNKKGVYSTQKLTAEKAASLFGEDAAEGSQQSLV